MIWSTGSADGLHVGWKRKTGEKALASVTGRMELPFTEMGKTIGGAGFENQELSFGNIRFEMLKNTPILTEIEEKNYPICKRQKT